MKQLRETTEPIWKVIAISLIGIVATGASAWMVFDQNAVGREEVSRLIEERSPYVLDRQMIRQTLELNTALLEKVASDVSALKVEQARLGERIAMLTANGDKILQRIKSE